MRNTALPAGMLVGIAIAVAVQTVGQTPPSVLLKPKNTSAARVRDPQRDPLVKATSVNKTIEALRLKPFSEAILTPRQPANDMAGLFMERPAEYDPLRDLISFYGDSGNPAARFYALNFDKSFLIDFTINNKTGGQASFDMAYGAAMDPNGTVGEGFVSEGKQTVQLNPGVQHATYVIKPSKSGWQWVAMVSKQKAGLWYVVSVKIKVLN